MVALMNATPPSPRTRVRRVPRRARYDHDSLHRVLDAGYVAHVAFAIENQPYCIPMAYVRLADHVYLHGATSSRLVEALAAGLPACLTTTLLDGLVLARSAFHHSMNYRSAVCLGRLRLLDDPDEKARALDALVERMVAGRAAEVRAPSAQELKATAVLALALEEASVKIRTGDPIDDEADLERPCWAGVLPLAAGFAAPAPSADLRPGLAPPSPARYLDRANRPGAA
jgi:nitroimidazol reductase NimA-like FMN-containing flavoprotein (pyridoxamine 5'-phosphate oxidase superfamily)